MCELRPLPWTPDILSSFFSQTPRWDAVIFAAGVSEDPLCHVLGTSGSFYLRSSGLFLLPEVTFWDQSW